MLSEGPVPQVDETHRPEEKSEQIKSKLGQHHRNNILTDQFILSFHCTVITD